MILPQHPGRGSTGGLYGPAVPGLPPGLALSRRPAWCAHVHVIGRACLPPSLACPASESSGNVVAGWAGAVQCMEGHLSPIASGGADQPGSAAVRPNGGRLAFYFPEASGERLRLWGAAWLQRISRGESRRRMIIKFHTTMRIEKMGTSKHLRTKHLE